MRKFDLLAILAVIAGVILLALQMDKPFYGQFDWTGTWFGTIARNYLEMDPRATKLAPIAVAGTNNPEEWIFYNHYPIFYPLIIAASLWVFGVSEWSIRLVPMLFSGGILAVLYLLCRKYLKAAVGIWGIIAISVTPMFLYYGKLPIHEQTVIFFSLLALYFYLAKRFRALTIMVALAFFTSWTGIYMLFLISSHQFLTDRKQLLRLIPPYLAVVGILALHFSHVLISSSLGEFFETLAERTGGGTQREMVIFTPWTFILRQARWFIALYSKPLAVISVVNLIWIIFVAVRKKKLELSGQILLVFFTWGFFQWFVVSRITWIHDYMQIYFLPFVALSAGQFFARAPLILPVIVLMAIWTSLPFTQALLSSADQTAEMYFASRYISERGLSGQRVVLLLRPDSEFEVHYPRHYFSFYTNDYVNYLTISMEEWQKEKGKLLIDYDYIIIRSEETDPALVADLDKTLSPKYISGFNIYENFH